MYNKRRHKDKGGGEEGRDNVTWLHCQGCMEAYYNYNAVLYPLRETECILLHHREGGGGGGIWEYEQVWVLNKVISTTGNKKKVNLFINISLQTQWFH